MDEEEAAGKGESTDDEEETEEMRMLREEKEAADQKKEWADVMLEQEKAYSTLFKWFLLLLFSKWFYFDWAVHTLFLLVTYIHIL